MIGHGRWRGFTAAAADGIGYAIWTGNSFTGSTATGQRSLFDVFSILGQFADQYEPNDSRDPGVATDREQGACARARGPLQR